MSNLHKYEQRQSPLKEKNKNQPKINKFAKYLSQNVNVHQDNYYNHYNKSSNKVLVPNQYIDVNTTSSFGQKNPPPMTPLKMFETSEY